MNDDDGVSNFQHNLVIRLFKMLDFGYSNVIYFTMATCIMALINRLFFGNVISEHQERKKKTPQLVVEVFLNAWLSGISLYFARHVSNSFIFRYKDYTDMIIPKYTKSWVVRLSLCF